MKMKNWTNKQTMIVVGSLLLLLAVRTISQMAQENAASNQPLRPAQQGSVSAPAREFGQDSSDAEISMPDAEQATDGTLEQPIDNGLPSMDANTNGFGPSETQPIATQPTETQPGTSGMDSDDITQRYQTQQESQDRIFRDQDNLIKDEVTLENPTTGEVMQGEAGSSNYYQSPSIDGATGEATIIGADGGYTPPADATQLNIVGSDSGSSTP
jgi:hypothetical protein